MLGSVARDQLFGAGADPTGATIRIKNQPFTVVGVLTSKGQAAMGQDQDDTVIVPYTTVQKRLLGVQHVTSITISAADGVDLDRLSDAIASVLRERHRLQPGAADDFLGADARGDGERADVDDRHHDLPAGRASPRCRCSSAASAS